MPRPEAGSSSVAASWGLQQKEGQIPLQLERQRVLHGPQQRGPRPQQQCPHMLPPAVAAHVSEAMPQCTKSNTPENTRGDRGTLTNKSHTR